MDGARWKSDFDKFVVLGNFERRGWSECPESDPDWDIYWANTTTIKGMFASDSTLRLQPHQLVNHFPNHYELTRKVQARFPTRLFRSYHAGHLKAASSYYIMDEDGFNLGFILLLLLLVNGINEFQFASPF